MNGGGRGVKLTPPEKTILKNPSLLRVKHIRKFDQIAQWVERVLGKHNIECLNSTPAHFLYGVEKT